MSDYKNYTDEMVAKMVADYKIEPTRATVDNLAQEMGKTTKSIIAKLVTLGVYKSQAKPKAKGFLVRKGDLVKDIEGHFGFAMPSLVKATKDDLQSLLDNL